MDFSSVGVPDPFGIRGRVDTDPHQYASAGCKIADGLRGPANLAVAKGGFRTFAA